MTNPTITTRRATEEDAALLSELGERTFKDAFREANNPADMAQYLAKAFAPEIQLAELQQAGSVFLLGYDAAFAEGNEPVGYVRLQDASHHDSVTGPSPVELVRIYIEAAATGGGYGTGLMSACLEAARDLGGETMWLGAWQQNDRAMRFYQRWGFEVVGQREFVVGNDAQTDWVMARAL